MRMRWEQTCSKGMMMMMFMEGGGFHAVAAWRKAGRLWEGPQFRNLLMYRRPLPSGNRTIDVPAILCCFLLRRALSHAQESDANSKVGVTIRLDMLDALLRKGLFDKTISIGLPSQEGRLAILQVHSHNKGFKSEKEKQKLLTELPSITFDHSGAGLQNVLRTRLQFWQQGRINILVRELICWRLSEG